jgi:hypothetical protein
MAIYKKIYNTLQVSTPTNDDLAKMIYGKSTYNTRGNIRAQIAKIRKVFNVSVIADQFGRYHTSIPQYTYQDSQVQNVGKIGRPRHYVSAA